MEFHRFQGCKHRYFYVSGSFLHHILFTFLSQIVCVVGDRKSICHQKNERTSNGIRIFYFIHLVPSKENMSENLADS